MPISLVLVGELFEVRVEPPEGPKWHSPRALTATEVLEELSRLDCHSTDITDALYEADATWTERHDAEVARRRA